MSVNKKLYFYLASLNQTQKSNHSHHLKQRKVGSGIQKSRKIKIGLLRWISNDAKLKPKRSCLRLLPDESYVSILPKASDKWAAYYTDYYEAEVYRRIVELKPLFF